ncbi:MAG: LacI family transcriptional regulator [Pseudobutyrivibrio sp.]|uniref:LacI family DNA-binding transcriptional regulator n=1 Tax=Pseudobutyrivibrio sp. TaxID=2014367 RepID=UPI0025DA1744|nr:LacI family DNA-binding transcriptional regulator [Pseudobutyrivibrio sp.]MBE5904146.1 LacI family transcriptional regulator [Pseudobutyrivibrio sp.]
MANKVTIQDIADALGVSRNTVSKAINNTGILADSTREKVLAKAVEMGYKQFSYANSVSDIIGTATVKKPPVSGDFTLFIGGFLDNSHFASTMLDKFQHEITTLGYSMSMHRVTSENIESLSLPVSFNKDRTAGIICVEMFNQEYCEMLGTLGIPLLFVDGPVASYSRQLEGDFLMMDNSAGIFKLITDMKNRGVKKIGFVGESHHCRSFFERYMAFRNAMYLNELPIDEKFCLTHIQPHGTDYFAKLFKTLSSLKELPELLICANDFVAIDIINCLKLMEKSYPDDIMLCGFDDSAESKVMTPALTTCHIHSQAMGYTAANLLLSRIEQPDLNYRTVYTETNLIYRESTRD